MQAVLAAILGLISPILMFFVKDFLDGLYKKSETALLQEKQKLQIADFKTECLKAVKLVDLDFVLPLKEAGEWSEDRAAEAKSRAINEVRKHYLKEQQVELTMLFSVDAEGLMHLIGDTIEAAILINKNAGSINLQDEAGKLPEKFVLEK